MASDYTTSCETRVILTGLTSAKTYWVGARANGALGPSGWSNPATTIAV
ncbi:MAG TPA: hypothetical protein VGI60_04740 [Chthoniobacterales bacterium]